MTFKLAAAGRVAKADAFGLLLNSGYIRIYAGVEPDPDAAITIEVLLAELQYNATAYGAAVDDGTDAVITAGSISDDLAADASGTAAFFREYKTDGVTVVGQGNVTIVTGGGDMEISDVTINAGGVVAATSATHTQPQV